MADKEIFVSKSIKTKPDMIAYRSAISRIVLWSYLIQSGPCQTSEHQTIVIIQD